MACSTINRSITVQALVFIALFSALSFSLQAGKPGLELELNYDYDRGLSVFLSGIYTTDYVETRVKVDPRKSFPKNISFNALHVHKPGDNTHNAISAMTTVAVTAAGTYLLLVAQKEIAIMRENKKIDLYLQRCDEAISKSDPGFEKLEKRLAHD